MPNENDLTMDEETTISEAALRAAIEDGFDYCDKLRIAYDTIKASTELLKEHLTECENSGEEPDYEGLVTQQMEELATAIQEMKTNIDSAEGSFSKAQRNTPEEPEEDEADVDA